MDVEESQILQEVCAIYFFPLTLMLSVIMSGLLFQLFASMLNNNLMKQKDFHHISSEKTPDPSEDKTCTVS